MQGDEVEFEFTQGSLETPSLMTPNIVLHAPPIKAVFNTISANMSTSNNISSTSNPSLIITTSTETQSPISSADIKVSEIEDKLKQSFSEPRKPTPSPFQKISSNNNVFILDKPSSIITNDDGTTIEIPSTADVVKELEALTNVNPLQFQVKALVNANQERETTSTTMNGDNIRYDSPPTSNMGIVSPKKKFLIRSQSHTEPVSPISNNNNHNNNISQSQKSNHDNSIINIQNGFDDENSIDDSVTNHFTRTNDLSTITHSNDTNIDNNQQFKPIIDNGHERHLNIQLKPEQNIISHPIIKQQTIVINSINNNNKRTVQSTTIGNNIPSLTKSNTTIISQPTLNEVTSTDQSSTAKRQRTVPIPIPTSVMNFRSSFPSSSTTTTTATTNTLTSTTTTNGNSGSDDQRKKQIRDSNREAARRCRERRRQYIETLEGNLEQHKAQIKQLSDKLARVERENTQLRAILSETKILHQAQRISANDSHVEYANVVAATGMNMNSESNHQIDGRTIQRSYIDRNNL
ncbi:unnamed protein product [Rotaria sp. Silwood1]|nr:unnamed protein product [Rotaria sp. Silwood1]CAF3525475.1 unnamed protein product [Rotaria sp. Silwood1]CAF3539959.1 unnamed protein product [Rotaria sp. Silwood1]CAF4993326.1 unnamed protein product [Rotaria sp. Silwood1]